MTMGMTQRKWKKKRLLKIKRMIKTRMTKIIKNRHHDEEQEAEGLVQVGGLENGNWYERTLMKNRLFLRKGNHGMEESRKNSKRKMLMNKVMTVIQTALGEPSENVQKWTAL